MVFDKAKAANYLDAVKIRVVQDNLNTHNTSSFYQYLLADEAKVFAGNSKYKII